MPYVGSFLLFNEEGTIMLLHVRRNDVLATATSRPHTNRISANNRAVSLLRYSRT